MDTWWTHNEPWVYRKPAGNDPAAFSIRMRWSDGQQWDSIISSYDLKMTKVADAAEGWTLKRATTTVDTTSAMAQDIKVAALVSEKSTRDSEYRYEIKLEGRPGESNKMQI